jgi:hypothetical protein
MAIGDRIKNLFGGGDKTAPQIPDPIVGEVFGNVLDHFNSYTYNAKLYMIPAVGSKPPGASTPSADGLRSTQSMGRASTTSSAEGGFLHNYYKAIPEETVVLAQTGVTAANQIDEISIENIAKYDTGFETTGINFSIIQPGAANFLDQILYARKHLGIEPYASDCPLFLEINFQGYDEDIDNPEIGGMPLTTGPWIWRMALNRVSLDITEEGSRYEVSCVATSSIPYQDQFYTMQKNFDTSGRTITKHIKQLEAHIKEYAENNMDKYQIQDEIVFDLSGLVGGEDGLKNEKLTSNTEQMAETTNRIMNPELEGKTPEEYEDIMKDAGKEEGTLNIVVEDDKINIKEGVSVYDYICTLLSMNKEFFDDATRSVNAQDPKKIKADKKKNAFTKWIKINSDIEYIGFDSMRNIHAKKITYKPYIYLSADERVQAQQDENILTEEENQARIADMSSSVYKSYHYLFSGRNDQIINCDISYDTGIAFLLPPAGGTTGDFSVTGADLISDSASLDKDLTGGELANSALEAQDERAVDRLFSNADQNDILGLGKMLKYSAQELKEAVDNKNSVSAKGIKDLLKDRALLSNILENEQKQKQKTAADAEKQTDGSEYSNRRSGYVYSGDLIGDISSTAKSNLLWGQARNHSTTAKDKYETDDRLFRRGNARLKEGKDAADSVEPPYQQMHIVNDAGESTFDGTPRNNLFGYYMQQHANPDFLLKLDMNIKGDPWYLGSPFTGSSKPVVKMSEHTDDSNSNYVVYDKRDNLILFDMQSPRLFDFDVDEEDNNTGYWSQEGTAYFISGVYFLIKAVSKFSGGVFTQELGLTKNTALKLSKLEKKVDAAEQHNDRQSALDNDNG